MAPGVSSSHEPRPCTWSSFQPPGLRSLTHLTREMEVWHCAGHQPGLWQMGNTLIAGRSPRKLLKTGAGNCVVARRFQAWSLDSRTGKRRDWNEKHNSSPRTILCKALCGMAGPQRQKIVAGYPDWPSCPKFPQNGHSSQPAWSWKVPLHPTSARSQEYIKRTSL